MQLGAYEIAIIGVGATIVGTLIGALLSYYFGRRLIEATHNNNIELMRRKDFNEAAINFRATFKDEHLALNPALARNSPDACDLLTAAFDKHRAAIFVFKPFLSTADADELEKVWQEYYRYPNAPDWTVPGLTQYSGNGCSISEARQRKLLAAERIERVLSYAHYK